MMKGSNSVSVGYDEGTVMFKIGREDPVASMDTNGKIIWSKHNDIQTVNVKSLPAEYDIQDGDRLPWPSKTSAAATCTHKVSCMDLTVVL